LSLSSLELFIVMGSKAGITTQKENRFLSTNSNLMTNFRLATSLRVIYYNEYSNLYIDQIKRSLHLTSVVYIDKKEKSLFS